MNKSNEMTPIWLESKNIITICLLLYYELHPQSIYLVSNF